VWHSGEHLDFLTDGTWLSAIQIQSIAVNEWCFYVPCMQVDVARNDLPCSDAGAFPSQSDEGRNRGFIEVAILQNRCGFTGAIGQTSSRNQLCQSQVQPSLTQPVQNGPVL